MLLVLSLVVPSRPRRRDSLGRGRSGRARYWLGMLGLVGRDRPGGLRLLPPGPDHGLGAGDEHVRDGHLGLAGRGGPVLIFELIYRRTYVALAGSAVALLGTITAANVPLLDPSIKSLQPVLRSNLWLTIHVLTEVSSYAAFALAWGWA